MRGFRHLGFIVFLFGFGACQASAEPIQAAHTTVELVAERDALVPGGTTELALHFDLEDHWHVYWKNPGASGLPLEIEWELPEGYEVGEIRWPAPERIPLGGLVNYGYEEEVTFVVPLSVPASLETGGEQVIRAEASWLICKEICLPGDAEFELRLPVAESAGPGPKAALFEAARASLPEAEHPWSLSGAVEGEELRVRIEAGGDEEIPADLYLYAGSEGTIDPNAPQAVAFQGPGTAILSARLDNPFLENPAPGAIDGVLQSGEESWAVSIPLGGADAGGGGANGNGVGLEGWLLDLGLAGWLVLAFLGGLILNIMPCVLPVLSLKVFSLLKHSGQTRGQSLAHGLAYTAGVVASFVALAGLLFALRAVGERIGWGFQLQSPGFVVALTVLFFVFGLNLLGVFEVGGSLVGADRKVSQRRDWFGSFGTGVLAAVVGAPCIGPFVGGVSGVALQAEAATGIAVFAVMGLGMAAPFLLLALFPTLVGYLPKPGPWMETFKQLMGFLLMGAVVFLVWVAGTSGGMAAVTPLLLVLLAAAVGAWIYGRWGGPVKSKGTRRLALLLGAAAILGPAAWGAGAVRGAYAIPDDAAAVEADGNWRPWSEDAVEEALEAGRPVFVDFTASWCLICQVNKRTTLRSEETRALFEEHDVVALEADWTRYDAAITDELERYGRSGVPLYLLHRPDGGTEVLPQNLTNGIVRAAVENPR